jgi:hypothetical protein
MTGASLYRWPPAAKLGRIVPKTRFSERTSISTAVRQTFSSRVQRITWAYKLADETVRLRGDAAVPEIQVFSIDAKDEDVSEDVLVAIDKAVGFPIIFEINRVEGERTCTRMVASYKQLGGATPRLSAYFTTEWLPSDGPRVPLPLALDLSGLYAGLLAPIFPIAPRPGEEVAETTGRINQVRKLEREIAHLEKRLRVEPQLNRKIDLRRELLDRTVTIDALLSTALTDHVTPKTEDVPWTN